MKWFLNSVPPISASAILGAAVPAVWIIGPNCPTALSAVGAATAVSQVGAFCAPNVLMNRPRVATASGSRRLPALSQRVAPTAVSAVLTAYLVVQATACAIVVPLILCGRLATAHSLG